MAKDRDPPGLVEAATGLRQALLGHEHGAGSAGAASGDEPVRAALLDCRVLLAGLEQEADTRRRGLHPGAREGLRDQRMADLLTLHRAADGQGAGAVLLLAHNVHVSREVPVDARYRRSAPSSPTSSAIATTRWRSSSGAETSPPRASSPRP